LTVSISGEGQRQSLAFSYVSLCNWGKGDLTNVTKVLLWDIMDSKYSITYILGNRLTTTVPLSV